MLFTIVLIAKYTEKRKIKIQIWTEWGIVALFIKVIAAWTHLGLTVTKILKDNNKNLLCLYKHITKLITMDHKFRFKNHKYWKIWVV
jgi:hypothetical protein